jgi:hypothetical protein
MFGSGLLDLIKDIKFRPYLHIFSNKCKTSLNATISVIFQILLQ